MVGLLDQPVGIVAGDKGADAGTRIVDGLEDAAMDRRSFGVRNSRSCSRWFRALGGGSVVRRRASEAHLALEMPSSKWMAKLWCRVCTATRLLKSAAQEAERQAACSTQGSIGRSARLGNSRT